MIRVGLIGAGFMGRNHFNQYEKMGDRAKVVALSDKEADRRSGDWSRVGGNVADAQGTKRELKGVKQYVEAADLIADPNVDMIDICVPTNQHKEIAVAGLKAGKHVLCEKPMALTVAECDEMLAAAKQAKGRFMIAQVIRFWPEYVYLKQVIDGGEYGELKALHLRRQAATPDYSLNNWIIDPKLSGGGVLDLHVHDVDFALSLFGKPKAVFAQGYPRNGGAIDRVHASWNYGNDRVMQIEGYWDMPKGFAFNMGLTAVFEKAAMFWDMASGKPLTIFPAAGGEPQTPKIPAVDGYFTEIAYFLTCIERGENPQITTPAESRDAVALALAEKQSILSGKPVTVR